MSKFSGNETATISDNRVTIDLPDLESGDITLYYQYLFPSGDAALDIDITDYDSDDTDNPVYMEFVISNSAGTTYRKIRFWTLSGTEQIRSQYRVNGGSVTNESMYELGTLPYTIRIHRVGDVVYTKCLASGTWYTIGTHDFSTWSGDIDHIYVRLYNGTTNGGYVELDNLLFKVTCPSAYPKAWTTTSSSSTTTSSTASTLSTTSTLSSTSSTASTLSTTTSSLTTSSTTSSTASTLSTTSSSSSTSSTASTLSTTSSSSSTSSTASTLSTTSSSTSSTTTTTPPPPPPPEGVSATQGVEQITISWDAEPDADSYNLYWESPKIPNCYFEDSDTLNEFGITKTHGTEEATVTDEYLKLHIPDSITGEVRLVYDDAAFLMTDGDVVTVDMSNYVADDPGGDGHKVYLEIKHYASTEDQYRIYFCDQSGTYTSYCEYNIDNSGLTYDADGTNLGEIPTALRIERDGTTFNAYAKKASGWTLIKAKDFGADAAELEHIVLGAQHTSDRGGEVRLDNLIITPSTRDTGTKITGATSPYVHSPLVGGDLYTYQVTSVNEYGEGDPSLEVFQFPGDEE